jgi:hypothetical protein
MKFTGLMKNNNEDLLNKIVHLMETDDSADAPKDSIAWTKNLFLSRAAQPKRSIVQKVLAVLQMDLSPDKAAFGERSASSASDVRQMLFGAGEHQIDLRIAKANKAFTVAGQILGEDFAGAEIALFTGGKKFTAKTNELGEFRFENISKDKYTLSLTFKDKEIVIEDIEIE